MEAPITSETITVDQVKAVVVETLGVADRADQLTADSELAAALPELDSMAVLELLTEFERRFGIEVQPEDVTAEAFENLGAITDLLSGTAV